MADGNPIVGDRELVRAVFAGGLRFRPAGQSFGDRIHVLDTPLVIGRDDGIADAGERDRQTVGGLRRALALDTVPVADDEQGRQHEQRQPGRRQPCQPDNLIALLRLRDARCQQPVFARLHAATTARISSIVRLPRFVATTACAAAKPDRRR